MKPRIDLTDAQIDDLNNRREFIRDAMPDSWLSYAEELEEAAELLWENKDNSLFLEGSTQLNGSFLGKKSSAHSRSYILLASLALENVLKGLIIVNDAKLIADGYLDKSLQSHKLLDLAKRVKGLVLSKDEKHILEVCQDAIPYWGRYPIPLEYKGLKPKAAASDEFHVCFKELHFRLCKLLYDAVKNGWDSGAGTKIVQYRNIRYGDTIDLKERRPVAGRKQKK